MANFRNLDVIVFKGKPLINLLKGIFKCDIYALGYFFIEMGTLSRYVHTATLIIHKRRYFLYQANLFKGVHLIEVDRTWLKDKVNLNEAEILRLKPKLFDSVNERFVPIYELCTKLIETDTNYEVLGKYNSIGILNMSWYLMTGKTLIKRSKAPKIAFCSELTIYTILLKPNSHLISPVEIYESDLVFRKIT